MAVAAEGDAAGARAESGAIADVVRKRLESESSSPFLWSCLGLTDAMLGNKGEAVRHARKAVELNAEFFDAFDGPWLDYVLAVVYAQTGEKELAIEEIGRVLRVSGRNANVHALRRALEFAPLRGDPRFQALLDDPKNNTPLL